MDFALFMPPHPRAQVKGGNESSDVQPPRQGAPADTAETMPMQPPQDHLTDSQPPDGYFSVKGGNQLVSAGEENMLEEGAEEEHMTDDEMIEPVRTHEQVEKEDDENASKVHDVEQEAVGKGNEGCTVQEQTKGTEQPAPRDDVVPPKEDPKDEKSKEDDPDLRLPTSPGPWDSVLDSDEEINSPDKKKKRDEQKKEKKEVKATFQET